MQICKGDPLKFWRGVQQYKWTFWMMTRTTLGNLPEGCRVAAASEIYQNRSDSILYISAILIYHLKFTEDSRLLRTFTKAQHKSEHTYIRAVESEVRCKPVLCLDTSPIPRKMYSLCELAGLTLQSTFCFHLLHGIPELCHLHDAHAVVSYLSIECFLLFLTQACLYFFPHLKKKFVFIYHCLGCLLASRLSLSDSHVLPFGVLVKYHRIEIQALTYIYYSSIKWKFLEFVYKSSCMYRSSVSTHAADFQHLNDTSVVWCPLKIKLWISLEC